MECFIRDSLENVKNSLNNFVDEIKDNLNVREVIEFDYIKSAGYPFNLKYSEEFSIAKQTVPLLKKDTDEVIGRLEIDTKINYVTDPALGNKFSKKCVIITNHDYYFYPSKNIDIFAVDDFKHLHATYTWHNEANAGRFAPGSVYIATFGAGDTSDKFLNRSGRIEITTRPATDPREPRRSVKVIFN